MEEEEIRKDGGWVKQEERDRRGRHRTEEEEVEKV